MLLDKKINIDIINNKIDFFTKCGLIASFLMLAPLRGALFLIQFIFSSQLHDIVYYVLYITE